MGMELEERLRRVGQRHARIASRRATEIAPVEKERDELIRAAAAAGFSRRKIAGLLGGISFQRVDQIIKDE